MILYDVRFHVIPLPPQLCWGYPIQGAIAVLEGVKAVLKGAKAVLEGAQVRLVSIRLRTVAYEPLRARTGARARSPGTV